ncbi:MAG: CDP-glycerol glycerophosphotransferase family protein [Verrucomicrobia bacterium]|nr:CDP-glycerol glycerophosphotransferase family protein [Verrucomicrobiota bacterium]
MSLIRTAAFLYGRDLHHLDHIGPLSIFLKIPLLVTEEAIGAIAKAYYPKIEVILLDRHTFAEKILTAYDLIFTTLPKQILEPLFFFEEHKQRKKLHTCWLPHGNSDKDNLGALTQEKLFLLYGKQMEDTLKQRGVPISHKTFIGNLRHHLYLENKKFFDKRVEERIYFPKEQPTLFYAPTWGGASLEEDLYFILKNIPPSYNLLVKMHPNTLHKGFVLSLKELYRDKKNIVFIEDMPLIYPLLARSAIYIGDHSSIAYDFLSLDKPLFFLTDKRSPIHQAGRVVSKEELFSSLKEKDIFSEAREALDSYTFAKVNYEELPNQIWQEINQYLEEELYFL